MNNSFYFSNETFIKSMELTSDANLIIYGNTAIKGWLFSWTTSLLSGLIIGLIIWNMYLTYKLFAVHAKGEDNE